MAPLDSTARLRNPSSPSSHQTLDNARTTSLHASNSSPNGAGDGHGHQREVSLSSAKGVEDLVRQWAVRSGEALEDDDDDDDDDEEADEEDDDDRNGADDDEDAGDDDEDVEGDEDDPSDDDFHSAGSGSPTSSVHSSDVPSAHLRRLILRIPPHELTDAFPTTSLLRILASARSLTQLHIAYTDSLLAHDPRIPRVLSALSSLTHLVLSEVGPRGCELLPKLKVRLEEVEVAFDDFWVSSVISASVAKPGSNAIVLSLPNGESSGLLTPVPTPATTPAAGPATILPDPVPLLVHSMQSLKALRASNAIIVTVADKLRYPAVRTLALRLAGVPTVTPLVHAFPSVSDIYVYTPYDGCGVRVSLPPSSALSSSSPPHSPPVDSVTVASPTSPTPPASPTQTHKQKKRQHRSSMPSIHATREANLTSQLYSSFPPLARVRGFTPGLYALGFSCAVDRLEIGSLSADGDEAAAVRKVLAEVSPRSLSLGLERGWWDAATVVRRVGKARGTRSWKGKEREGLRTLFGGGSGGGGIAIPGESESGGALAAGAGLSELTVRVEEPGRWVDVTRDLLALLAPLAGSLTTFVLRWDRTSVPFDRIPQDEDDTDSTGSGAGTEAFAKEIAEQMSCLRYVLFEILHDANTQTPLASSPSLYSSPSAAFAVERRFWRIDRSEGWLCLDALGERAARQVMDADGLSFDDRVRYSA
ncbi:hypothetical protein C8Q80DRAFT_1273697 [Daedaleopsis nitida]|nr:hypothetical protein C8Q80DRAFT_1273697 [Daedaleopsis nitida]